MLRVFVGYDPRESLAYQVCVASMLAQSSIELEVMPLVQAHLRALGLYRRPEAVRGKQSWDLISRAPVSTEFALTRFLVPKLAGYGGWALFCDGDFLWRDDVASLLDLADPERAVLLVKHDHRPSETVKMDGRLQTPYARKNWSSLMLFNCAHRAHRIGLTDAAINGWPGLDLHAFRWLKDSAIGALPEAWNWLVGSSDRTIAPKAVHFTRGTPDMPGHETAAYADEWRAVAELLACNKDEGGDAWPS